MFFGFKLKFTGMAMPGEENESIYDREGWVNSYLFEICIGPYVWYTGWQKPIDDPHKNGSNIDWEWGWD